MSPTTRFKRLLLYLYLIQSLQHALVSAQNCYYPNGDLSKDDAPCSSADGAACCPKDWQCLDNGLCYLDNQKYFGRYTCTDKSWQSSSCPHYCTTDSGNQAVQQCSNHNGQYCCDHNRDPSNYCCKENDPKLFFALPQGNPTALIKSLGGPAEATGSSGNDNENDSSSPQNKAPTSTNPPATDSPIVNIPSQPANPATSIVVSRPSFSIPSVSPATITSSITQSGRNGQTSIVLLTSVISTTPSPTATASNAATPAPASAAPPSSSSSSSSSTNTAAAIGGGVGGGVAALILLYILLFLLRRRRNRRKAKKLDEATIHRPQTYLADERAMEYMYKGQHGDGTPYTGTTVQGGEEGSPEIDGKEIKTAAAAGGRPRPRPRPGEATRVEKGSSDKSEGLGLGAPLPAQRQEEVSELPGEDIPRRRDDGAMQQQPPVVVDKWRRYDEMAAGGRR
ncbi:MAG: hypothetical protein Q9213_004822 [Squamulea squamosa]